MFSALRDINLRIELLGQMATCLNCEQLLINASLCQPLYHDCHLVDSDFIAQSLVRPELREVKFDRKIVFKSLYNTI